jgi:hypothetical protein
MQRKRSTPVLPKMSTTQCQVLLRALIPMALKRTGQIQRERYQAQSELLQLPGNSCHHASAPVDAFFADGQLLQVCYESEGLHMLPREQEITQLTLLLS